MWHRGVPGGGGLFWVRLVDVFVGCFLSGSDELKVPELHKASPELRPPNSPPNSEFSGATVE